MELPPNATLLVIDVQEGMNLPERGRRSNPMAEENIQRLLDAWRETGRPIIHVKHNSRRPDSPFHPSHPGNVLQTFAIPRPGEPLIEKEANCAFIGTGLEQRLRSASVNTLVIVGMVTNHCVESTARMSGELDFTTYVVTDATAAFDRMGPDGSLFAADLVHAISMASIHGEFASVVDTDAVLTVLGLPAKQQPAGRPTSPAGSEPHIGPRDD